MNNDINYNVEKVVGMSCPNKFLVTINGQTICFVNSKNGASPVINYAYTKDSQDLQNKKIKRRIDIVLGRN